ncbi:MAG: M42 family metallopeptidase [Chloroflexi bacterium]|nr:M42 family metallopeptidase [Chloroflexota bacterium]
MDRTEQMLRELTEASGVAGHEREVRALLSTYFGPLGQQEQDRIGSLACRQGESGPRVMLAGHMDEIGLMVNYVTPEGFLRFLPLGMWLDQVLLGQRVVVQTRKGDIPGFIGFKPPHLMEMDERARLVNKRDMFIDIGATSKDETVEAGVRVGDPVVPAGTFEVMANGKSYMSKAFDDRVGVAVVVDVLRHFASRPHPNVIYGCATAMEELGSRGAKTLADLVHPDVAIVLESDICGDVPDVKTEESPVRLGAGPGLKLHDARMIPNPVLRDLVVDTAAELGIPLQLSASLDFANDGMQIHVDRVGVPCAVVTVPARHIHSHGSIIHRTDYDQAVQVVVAVVAKLDSKRVASLTKSDARWRD